MFRHAALQHPQRKLLTVGFGAGGAVVLVTLYQTSNDHERTLLESNNEPVHPSFGVRRMTHVPTPVFPSKPLPTRPQQLERLHSGEQFAIIVVGGGATGCGVALDAATRTLSVALIERGDFGNETSSRSTKLIWAGIRYIATALSSLLRVRNVLRPIDAVSDFVEEFKMVAGAHKERRLLLENNPHLTNWVPIAIPIKSWVSWPPPFGHPLFAISPIVLPAVFKFYDSMSGFTCPPSHIMGRKRAMRKFPQLDEDAKYFQVFYEGSHNDARTATYLALTAAEEGAAVANYVEMIDLIRDNNGKAVGVKCRDNLTGNVFDVRAKTIVFAGGPFTDSLRKMEDPDGHKPAVAAAAGTHIVLPGYYSPSGIGMLDINTSDGRFLFFLPWEGHTIVGTTDRKGEPVSDPGPPEDEIRWLLKEVEKYLSPELKVRRADVLSAWQGFRPLASDPNAPPGAPASRDHVVSTNPETGVTFVTGGKWTTYREMAEDTINKILNFNNDLKAKAGPCVTDKMTLRGGQGYTRNVPIMLVQEFGVSDATARHLARSYGMHAFEVCRMAEPTGKRWPRFGNLLVEGFPYLECEVEYACKNEMVCTLKDMLTLRMRIAYLNKDAAMSVAPRVADLMAKSMGWSKRERNRQLKEAEEHLATFGGPYPNKGAVKLDTSTVTDLVDLFRTFDADGTGYIDLAELKDVVKMLGFPFESEKEAERTFKQIDKNGDGKITEDEFVAWWHDDRKKSKLRAKLGEQFKFSADKLGTGPKSRGVGFG
jgi:glycerol-3-phosphate dehydrogenase